MRAPSDVPWQSDERTFRICVFEGADSRLSTFDYSRTSLTTVLEQCAWRSDEEARLWALAVVVQTSAGEPGGLVWLSGTDYRTRPSRPSGWRARREMQDRYLAARTRRGEAPLLPDGRRLIRMFFDHGRTLPLWETFTDHYTIERGALPLTPGLERDLATWQETWEDRSPDPAPGDDETFLTTAWALHARLERELEDIAEVRPDFC
ncbi:hypothetical protein [Auraticoccus monumenti]|uniref:hypothetical protein n=1 Tax=Auraticoccus monumenti TaxID=675864 RepID=UPI000B85273E|nr:hypothetical protein [Auraticoccus monumenti]